MELYRTVPFWVIGAGLKKMLEKNSVFVPEFVTLHGNKDHTLAQQI